MKRFITLILLAILFPLISHSTSGDEKLSKTRIAINDSLAKIKSEISVLKYELETIKRDKLNYEIEKGLLKSSFSSNLQVLNIFLTALLLFFTIVGGFLGYIGFKNISEVKSNYNIELDKLSKLRESYEKRFKGFQSREKVFQERMEEIESINATQSKKIRILEVKNSIIESLKNKNYSHSFKLANIALDESPEDYELNAYKSYALVRMKKYEEAVVANLKALELAKEQRKDMITNNMYNVLEFELFAGKIEMHKKHRIDYSDHLRYSTLNKYFDALCLFMENKVDDLKIHFLDYFKSEPKMVAFPSWSFEDLKVFINDNKKKPGYDLFLDFIKIIYEEMKFDEFIEKYDKN